MTGKSNVSELKIEPGRDRGAGIQQEIAEDAMSFQAPMVK